MKEGEYMQLVLIYPKYPLKNIVDPDWEEEYNAVSKIQGLGTGLYDDYEKLLIINNTLKTYKNPILFPSLPLHFSWLQNCMTS